MEATVLLLHLLLVMEVMEVMDNKIINLRISIGEANERKNYLLARELTIQLLVSNEWDEETKVSLSRKILIYGEILAGK